MLQRLKNWIRRAWTWWKGPPKPRYTEVNWQGDLVIFHGRAAERLWPKE